MTPLDAAAFSGHDKIVQLLIDKFDANAEINPQDPQDPHISPLHIAIMEGHLAVAKVLLQNDADVKLVKPNTKITPIEAAIGHKQE